MSDNDYHDFKPIIAEIEEKPVNPLGMYFLWTIIALMVVTVLGLIFVKIDVVVSARGKVIPTGDVKVVQPLETGVITKIHVKEGDYVQKGAILLEIDPSVDTADLEGKERNLNYSRLSLDRINAVLADKKFAPDKKDHSPDVIHAQTAQYQAQRSALKSLKEEMVSLNRILAVTVEDEKRLKALVEIGAVAENRYRDKIKDRMNLERERNSKSGQMEQFREKLLSDYSTNVQGRNTLEAEVSSLKFKQGKRFIIAPVTGYVHLLPVKTIGGVVTTAQPVVGIVPEGTPLEVNAVVMNKDIGYVKEGQRCVIKVDTFDFQKYGTLEGVVEVVNPYSVEDSKEKDKDKSKTGDADNESGGYPVRIRLKAENLKIKNGDVYKIKPGMAVMAEVNVGKRRVIEFFLFPVIRYLDEGLKVR
jgi:hemolysin D